MGGDEEHKVKERGQVYTAVWTPGATFLHPDEKEKDSKQTCSKSDLIQRNGAPMSREKSLDGEESKKPRTGTSSI
ncbi:hypothetical protein QQF64_001061 [Cirrhinus molitorella]|uniref:Prolactin receptor n=1 Tax=Cirrhinus molitorella TaxID=172907 RepID=A0ABR3NYY1_9TELE